VCSMQELRDIFAIWPSIQVMADDLDEKYDTVKRWRFRVASLPLCGQSSSRKRRDGNN